MRKKKNTPKPTFTDRRIIGFSLPPGLAAQVKIEAARRGLSLRKLFEEIWTTYKNAQAR